MRKLTICLLFCLSLYGNSAKGDILFSTSSTDPFAGSSLSLPSVGSTGSIYVYFSTATNSVLQGTSFNIDSSNASVLQATAHLVANPGNNRWQSINPGTLGDLVVDTRAVALFPPFGLGTSGPGDFVLYSEVQFTATGLGATNLSFSKGPLGLSYRNVPGDVWDTFVRGTGSVVVAIPEPSIVSLLMLGSAGLALVRRRH